jgi:hypothetical protein
MEENVAGGRSAVPGVDMSPIAQLLCFCTSIAFAPLPQVSQEAWDIRYTHEALGRGRHLLRLSTTDFILDSDPGRRNRLSAFAHDFATRTCPGRFVFLSEDHLTTYAGQFVFQCRTSR